MSRPRKHDPSIPEHIDQRKLPVGLYWDRSGKGRWYVLQTVDGRRKAKVVARADAKLSELHAIMEDLAGIDRSSVDWLLARFHESGDFRKLAARTQSDYEKYRQVIAKLPTKAGVPLGALSVARLSLPFMQRLFDAIADKHPTKANHLLRYLRRVFAWGMTRGHNRENPCKGAQAAKERKSVAVPERVTLAAVTVFARERGQLKAHTDGSCAPYLWIVMELAYLCRLRPVEAITLTDAHSTPAGVMTNRRKGSRDNVVAWSPRLRAAWDAAIALRAEAQGRRKVPVGIRPEDRPLIVSQDGAALSRSSADSAWQRMMRLAVAAGVITDDQRFGMHALKHRGITDTPGNRHEKRRASGHRADSMMDVYDHEVPVVEPSVPG